MTNLIFHADLGLVCILRGISRRTHACAVLPHAALERTQMTIGAAEGGLWTEN